MKSSFGIMIKAQELYMNKKITLITILSLTVGFFFVLLFSNKFLEINSRIQQLSKSVVNQNSYMFFITGDTLEQEILSRHDVNSSVSSFFVYIQSKGSESKEMVSIIDSNYCRFLKIQGWSNEDNITFFTNKNAVLLPQSMARKYRINEGDTLNINGNTYVCFRVLTDERLRNRIIMNDGALSEMLKSPYTSTLVYTHDLTENEIVQLELVTRVRSIQSDVYEEIHSLKQFRLFVGVFAALFVTMSLINCYLIFWARMENLVRNIAIKRIYGQTHLSMHLETLGENALLSLIGYHLSCIIAIISCPVVPDFFYIELNPNIYVIGLLIVLVISNAFSIMMTRRFRTIPVLTILREG